ncbi:MAG TPA: RNA polymerase-binding protein DksA [Campylobacterales bacterium]|nr:RNA polymerase-binding protein DksA [Campylobacterales bacterium]HIO71046.1 RNA polymerase-binding protein DksA [Campylobacterales bacterium]
MERLDIDHFLKLLEDAKREVETNLNHLRDELMGLERSEIRDEGDIASMSSERHRYALLIDHCKEELKEIEHALDKIENNREEFGVCEMCQDEIPIERLLVKPFALYCISCREMIEEEKSK